MRPFELDEGGFRLLDRAIDRCARHGLYAIIDLHALPGAQNQRWHSDNPIPFRSACVPGSTASFLLAEPLVDEFARCFESVAADEAAALADSFRFEACLKRDRLLDILRAAASA